MPWPVRLLAAILVVVGLVGPNGRSANAAEPVTITFVLTNDLDTMGERMMPDGRARGGFARFQAVVKAERAKGRPVIVTHAGDALSPSLMSALDRGEHIVALTNIIAPDIFVPGNHEFDFGPDIFRKRMGEATFPLYAANLRDADGHPLPGFRDRRMMEIAGIRIGVVGATYDGTPRSSSPGNLRFLPTVATVQREAQALRKEGADLVVAVVHAQRAQAVALATTRAADLILTGHSHDLFLRHDGRTLIAESGQNAAQVAVIDVTITAQGEGTARKVHWWPRLRVIDTADVEPDPDMAARVAALEAELGAGLDEPLATTAVELDSRRAAVRLGEAAIGNLIADAMRERTGADIAIMNGGGIRAARIYPAGSRITPRDVLSELPFGNRLVVLEVSGKVLRAALENAFGRLPQPRGGFPQVSGLAMEIDIAQPPGHRILSIRTEDGPLDDARLYRLATNDFIARGADGYEGFAKAKRIAAPETAPLLANEMMAHLRRLGTVTTGVEGR